MTPLRKAACIGGGVIGAGWVARLLLNGIDVTSNIINLYSGAPIAGGYRFVTPWLQLPSGVFELAVWIHGPTVSDRSIMRLRVP